jgi:hypothetical protein
MSWNQGGNLSLARTKTFPRFNIGCQYIQI